LCGSFLDVLVLASGESFCAAVFVGKVGRVAVVVPWFPRYAADRSQTSWQDVVVVIIIRIRESTLESYGSVIVIVTGIGEATLES